MANPRIRIAIIGQQDSGKTVLEAFAGRADRVAAVFCAPEKPGARPDTQDFVNIARHGMILRFADLLEAAHLVMSGRAPKQP